MHGCRDAAADWLLMLADGGYTRFKIKLTILLV